MSVATTIGQAFRKYKGAGAAGMSAAEKALLARFSKKYPDAYKAAQKKWKNTNFKASDGVVDKVKGKVTDLVAKSKEMVKRPKGKVKAKGKEVVPFKPKSEVAIRNKGNVGKPRNEVVRGTGKDVVKRPNGGVAKVKAKGGKGKNGRRLVRTAPVMNDEPTVAPAPKPTVKKKSTPSVSKPRVATPAPAPRPQQRPISAATVDPLNLFGNKNGYNPFSNTERAAQGVGSVGLGDIFSANLGDERQFTQAQVDDTRAAMQAGLLDAPTAPMYPGSGLVTGPGVGPEVGPIEAYSRTPMSAFAGGIPAPVARAPIPAAQPVAQPAPGQPAPSVGGYVPTTQVKRDVGRLTPEQSAVIDLF